MDYNQKRDSEADPTAKATNDASTYDKLIESIMSTMPKEERRGFGFYNPNK